MNRFTRALGAVTCAAVAAVALLSFESAPARAAGEADNLAVAGTAYRWARNVDDLSNANRAAAPLLNDGDTTRDVRLIGSSYEPQTAYEAAGVLWPETRTLGRFEFVNGRWETNGDGAFCAELELQATTDGTTWRDTGWRLEPAYAYDSSAAGGVRYRFSGAPIVATGVRVSGKVRCTSSGSYWANVSEVEAYAPPPRFSLWDDATTPAVADARDVNAVEVGVRFRATVPGEVKGLRFYKSAANTGTHTGSLWRADGTLLARTTFRGETPSGWQEAALDQPVQIAAGTTYVASYYAPAGHYAASRDFFAAEFRREPLFAVQNVAGAGNGLYRYGTAPLFPTLSFNATNYWVDVVFSAGSGPADRPPTTPAQLRAQVTGAGEVSLAWDPSSDDVGVESYEVVRDGTTLGRTSEPRYVDRGLAAGSTHAYKVRAIDTIGQGSAYSNEVTLTVRPPEACREVVQYGITFAFDREYPCGTFANGDWWVAPAAPGGHVVVARISPDATTGRNGFEVNPDSTTRQGFDSRARNYDATRIPALPYTASAGDSIVKEVSLPATASGCGVAVAFVSCIDTGAILTVLGAVPADRGAGLFRPPYFGDDKPLVETSRLRLDRLPRLAPVAGAPTLDEVTAALKRPQIDHQSEWHGGFLHPRQSLPDYGREIANVTTDAALRLMLNDAPEAKRAAAIAFVQYGIDLAAARRGGTEWSANGGWRHGRKLVMTLSAELLDDAEMRTLVSAAPYNTFAEDGHLFRSAAAGRVLWGAPCTAEKYWLNQHTSSPGDCRDPYGLIDGGLPGLENGTAGYEFCCTVGNYMQMEIALRLMPALQPTWSNPDLFEFSDRWASFGAWTQPDPYAPLGDGARDANPADGVGRYPTRHGSGRNASWAGTGFGWAMRTAYRDTAPPLAPAGLAAIVPPPF